MPSFQRGLARAKQRDFNRDGTPDLVMKVQLDQTTLAPGDDRVCISGMILGDAFEACQEVRVVENYGRFKKRTRPSKAKVRGLRGKQAKTHGDSPDHSR